MPTESIRLMDHHFYLFICSRLIENRNVHHRQNKINNNNEKSVCQVVKVLKTRWTISEPEKKTKPSVSKILENFLFSLKKIEWKKSHQEINFFFSQKSINCLHQKDSWEREQQQKQAKHALDSAFSFFSANFSIFINQEKKLMFFFFQAHYYYCCCVFDN